MLILAGIYAIDIAAYAVMSGKRGRGD